MSGKGEAPTFAEQTKSFKAFATTDGEVSAGGETAEEVAGREQAAVADATARTAAQKPQRAESNVETEKAAEAEGEVEASGEVSQDDSAATQSAEKPKPKKTAAQRVAEINAATRELREAQRQLAEVEARIAAREKGVATPQQGLTETKQAVTEDTSAPKPDDVGKDGKSLYEYGELDGKYIKALAAHEAKRAYAAEKAKDAETTQQTRLQAEQAENRQKLQAMMVKGAEKYDDFEEVVIEGAKNGDYPVSEVVGRLILGSDVGTDIAYHLASNPKEARQLAGKAPLEQAAYFGRLEARFSAPASGAKAKAPQTAQQATQPFRGAKGGGGSTQVTGATTDFAEFERLAMAKK